MRYRRSIWLGLLAAGTFSMAPLQSTFAKTGQIAQPIEEPKTENDQIHWLHQNTQAQKIASDIELSPVKPPTPEEKLNSLQEELKKLQQELDKTRQASNPQAEAEILNKISGIYIRLKRFEQALDSSRQALDLYKQFNNQESEISAIGKVIDVFFEFRRLQEATQTINQSLKDFRASKDTTDEQLFLNVLRDHLKKDWKFSAGFGIVANMSLQEDYRAGKISWEDVLEISEFNLFISRLVKDYKQEVESLHGIGWAYRNLGKFPDALSYYNQATAIAKSRSEKFQYVFLLVEAGIIYSDLGQYDRALKQFQTALSESLKPQENYSSTPIGYFSGNDEYKSRLLRGFALTKIGIIYINIGQYDKALKYLLEAKATGVQWDINTILLGLGMVYSKQGNYSKALESYQRALQMVVIGDPSARGEILNRIGFLYFQKLDYLNALDNFQKALLVFKELKNPVGEAITLSNIGFLLEKQSKPELAIVFYKESVNVSESIRQDLRRLTIEEQKAYTETVANTYRALADLLLSQGRVLEAQQVLELLKIQELRDYTRDTRTGGATSGSSLNPLEQPIPNAFTDKIALGNQLIQCEQVKCAERKQLIAQRDTANDRFIALVDRLKKALRKQEIKDPAQLQNDRFILAAQKVILANPKVKTVLVYPLVLDDKLWLVWGSQAGKSGVIFDSKEVAVTRKQLSEKVAGLQELLSKRGDSQKLQQVSQQLYQWLIAPIRKQLNENGVRQIVFSLDRATRYIPIAVLHDGKQFLIENFAISTILTAEIDTKDTLSPNPQDDPVLGLGLTQSVSGFPPLPAVKAEIDGIIRHRDRFQDVIGIYPGTELFDQDFTEATLREKVADYRILHIATHGKFIPGNPEDSFLVMGDGKELRIPTIRSMTALANIHLVVLSACETGKGGIDKEGLEVAGIGHYFLLNGAKSVMASLWLVNDPATSLLMREFYGRLSRGNITKAEALRQVQVEFLKGKFTTSDVSQRSSVGRVELVGLSPTSKPPNFSHPYYWAPFILIGNSL